MLPKPTLVKIYPSLGPIPALWRCRSGTVRKFTITGWGSTRESAYKAWAEKYNHWLSLKKPL